MLYQPYLLQDTRETLQLNVLLRKRVPLVVDLSWMRMKIVYVHLDMPLMKMVIVCHVLQNLGLLSTPKEDACVISHADSF